MVLRRHVELHSSLRDNYKQNNGIRKTLESLVFSRVLLKEWFSGRKPDKEHIVDNKYFLDRFIQAQKGSYDTALKEIRDGHKKSHWIWYIFPQITGRGMSAISEKYAIKNIEEAKAYMADKTLRSHLLQASEALLGLECSDPSIVMGFPDDLKLRSCMTLFAIAVPECTVFQSVLDKYYGGEMDKKTLKILQKQKTLQ